MLKILRMSPNPKLQSPCLSASDQHPAPLHRSSAQLATCRRHPGLQLCSFGAERLIIQMPRTPRPTIPPADHWPESFLGIASPAVAAAGFKQLRAWRAVRIELCELPATVNEGAGQEVRKSGAKFSDDESSHPTRA